MPKLLSIDVGMKNLGFCLFNYVDNKTWTVLKWDCINICEEKIFLCCCDCKGKPCNKPAKFTKNDKPCCKKHAVEFSIPNNSFHISKIKKMKIGQLFDFMDNHEIQYNKPITKAKIIENIETNFKEKYYDPIVPVRADAINLIDIGRTMKQKFDILFACDLNDLDQIIIENQISPLASRMKTLQGMITQYFIMRTNSHIEYMSSENKLKMFEDKKSSYSERKKLGILKTNEIINANSSMSISEWDTIFNKHKKKDDLADSFLQGLYYIQK